MAMRLAALAARSVTARVGVPAAAAAPAALRLSAAASSTAAPQAMPETCPYHAEPLSLEVNGGLKEYSVVYTDRALNHMSKPFVKIMQDINRIMTSPDVYNCSKAVMLPGSGTYAMEAVARQLVSGKKALVLRNGYFSYRWTDIFEQTDIPSETIVLKGQPEDDSKTPSFTPYPIDELEAIIAKEQPAVVFAPHVETSTGIMLPEDYVKRVSKAVQAYGGHFVLDCIASGTYWIDMKETGVDVLITAPQKGWTGPACVGIAMLSERAVEAVNKTKSTSMVLNLKKWMDVLDSYLAGGFSYYTTMPTDAMHLFRNVAVESEIYGFKRMKDDAIEMGDGVRAMFERRGFKSVAAEGYKAPGVVVSYTEDPQMLQKFNKNHMQIAAGVPFMIDEPQGNHTFRIGLFGLDKLKAKKEVVAELDAAMETISKM